MRLWSLHPSCLDKAGLGAVWREALLAKAVLEDKTKGYRSHPQLERFRGHPDPIGAINAYLSAIEEEARNRNYSYDRRKIGPATSLRSIPVTLGQLQYEYDHLMRKISTRSRGDLYRVQVIPHPLFWVKAGEVESWEKIAYPDNKLVMHD